MTKTIVQKIITVTACASLVAFSVGGYAAFALGSSQSHLYQEIQPVDCATITSDDPLWDLSGCGSIPPSPPTPPSPDVPIVPNTGLTA